MSAASIPPEILQTLLNLAEFMERDGKPLLKLNMDTIRYKFFKYF